jgi:hypothetical protein
VLPPIRRAATKVMVFQCLIRRGELRADGLTPSDGIMCQGCGALDRKKERRPWNSINGSDLAKNVSR